MTSIIYAQKRSGLYTGCSTLSSSLLTCSIVYTFSNNMLLMPGSTRPDQHRWNSINKPDKTIAYG